jgi:NAD(P)-dependent dehydrogenase (short-subunit alcohol dehydrogenase family)
MAKLAGRIAVVTGASSGLGRATALELARRGATLVLAARRGDALDDTARRCREAGAPDALTVETDVSIESDVHALAARAVDAFGAIDIWINNAGVTLFAPLEQGPFDDHQRVIETNLFGAMHGARAAIPIFRRQHHGTLINVGSVLSEVGHAFVPAYVISKFGMHGLTEALRVEVADEPDIHVCTVFPFTIDTPHFEVAANLIAQAPRALPPMQSPEKVARAIADTCERPRRVRFVPRSIVLGLALHALTPRTSERLLLDALRKFHISDAPDPIKAGNLYEPQPNEPPRTHGDRPPQLATWKFVVWAAGRFTTIAATGALRRMRRGWSHLTGGSRARRLARPEGVSP